jgi:uncharacterized protein GlcG (DUF336 family)
MKAMTLETANDLVAKAMERAAQQFARPVCVSVCDAAGFLVAFARADGAPLRSIRIAQAKAYTAVRMGVTTEALLARLHREQIEIGYFADPGLTALPGGSVLKDAAGTVIGGVGVSGLTSAEDQQITDHIAALVRGGVPG